MLFDPRPSELPVATLRSRSWSSTLASDLERWLIARWRWLKPRTVPVAVAFVGMIAILGAANYLTALARDAPPERLPAAQLVTGDGRLGDRLEHLQPGTIIELSPGNYYVVPEMPVIHLATPPAR